MGQPVEEPHRGSADFDAIGCGLGSDVRHREISVQWERSPKRER